MKKTLISLVSVLLLFTMFPPIEIQENDWDAMFTKYHFCISEVNRRVCRTFILCNYGKNLLVRKVL